MVIGIVAVDHNWGIGKDNHLLMSFKPDMSVFRNTTKNHVIVMGKNTFLSFPNQKPLKNRRNVVLTSKIIKEDNVDSFSNPDKLIEFVKTLSEKNKEDVYIIGGGMLYELMLPYYDKVIVTKYDSREWLEEGITPTVFFPNLDENKNFELMKGADIPFEILGIDRDIEIEDNSIKCRVTDEDITFPKDVVFKNNEKERFIEFTIYKRK